MLNTTRTHAENGDADAQYALSEAYRTILSSEENSAELSQAWKERAAEGGHKLAMEELGIEPE